MIMKKLGISFSIFLIFIILGVQILCAKSLAKTEAFYMPFDVQTYVPVTADNIEQQCSYHILTEDNSLAEFFISSLKRSDGKNFSGVMIRLKMRIKNNVYYVDSDGNVKSTQGTYVTNTEALHKKIIAFMHSIKKRAPQEILKEDNIWE
jgi:ABC-type microcin C transport system permease subunit YejE